MQKQILDKMAEFMAEITQIKEIYNYPLQGNPKTYPAMIFYPTGFTENSFNSRADNFKIYTFNLSVVYSTSGTTVKELFSNTLPKMSDKVVAEIDKNWNYGTVDGHRVWARAVNGSQEYSQEQSGGYVYLNITIEVKALTDI